MSQPGPDAVDAARRPTFELCAETLDACRAAKAGGADRIELCVDLHLDGITPPERLLADALAAVHLPIHVLVRPRPGGFVYDAAVFRHMQDSIRMVQRLGAAGVVTGMLNQDGTVAVSPMQELVALAAPLPVEFHRAFDTCSRLPEALEDVIATGCSRLLTSGGAPDVIRGASSLAALVRQAAGRIEIAAGGGLRISNAAQLAAHWAGTRYHGSLGGAADGVPALTERVRQLIATLQAAHVARAPQ